MELYGLLSSSSTTDTDEGLLQPGILIYQQRTSDYIEWFYNEANFNNVDIVRESIFDVTAVVEIVSQLQINDPLLDNGSALPRSGGSKYDNDDVFTWNDDQDEDDDVFVWLDHENDPITRTSHQDDTSTLNWVHNQVNNNNEPKNKSTSRPRQKKKSHHDSFHSTLKWVQYQVVDNLQRRGEGRRRLQEGTKSPSGLTDSPTTPFPTYFPSISPVVGGNETVTTAPVVADNETLVTTSPVVDSSNSSSPTPLVTTDVNSTASSPSTVTSAPNINTPSPSILSNTTSSPVSINGTSSPTTIGTLEPTSLSNTSSPVSINGTASPSVVSNNTNSPTVASDDGNTTAPSASSTIMTEAPVINTESPSTSPTTLAPVVPIETSSPTLLDTFTPTFATNGVTSCPANEPYLNLELVIQISYRIMADLEDTITVQDILTTPFSNVVYRDKYRIDYLMKNEDGLPFIGQLSELTCTSELLIVDPMPTEMPTKAPIIGTLEPTTLDPTLSPSYPPTVLTDAPTRSPVVGTEMPTILTDSPTRAPILGTLPPTLDSTLPPTLDSTLPPTLGSTLPPSTLMPTLVSTR